MYLDQMASPIGDMLLVTDRAGVLRALDFADCADRMWRLIKAEAKSGAAPVAIRKALADYFAGDLAAPARIAWDGGGTAFQRLVWGALTAIPAGTTMTYGGLAAQIGRPAAIRALGAANGANRVSIVVPCHRLIGADGTLTGYGGGLWRKDWLLRHESRLTPAAHSTDRTRSPAARR